MSKINKSFLNNEEKLKKAGIIELTKGKGKRTYICTKCNKTFEIRRQELIKNPSCRCCSTGASFGENVAIDILLNNNIEFEKEKTFEGLNGLGNSRLRFDFYIKKNDGDCFILEIDGEQHRNGTWSTNTSAHDAIKNAYCKEHDIKIYRVDYKFNKLDKVAMDVAGILVNEGFDICDYGFIPKPSSNSKKSKTTKNKYYAIKVGRKNNKIVNSWSKCKKLVDGYKGAKFKGFSCMKDAKIYLSQK